MIKTYHIENNIMDNVKKNDFIPYKDVGLEVAR